MAILGNAKACKDKVQKKDSNTKQCTSLQEKDCCSNQPFVKTGDDVNKKFNTELGAETIVFLNTFFYTYINLFEGLEKNVVPFDKYRLPLLYKDIQVLQETYLI